MTKEEQAIEYIKTYRKLDENLYNIAPKGTVSSHATKKCLEFWDMAIEALKAQQRNCKTCKHSDNENCAYTEKCHECMWENQYEPQRKHGKWIDFDGEYGVWECSECKTAFILNDGTPEDNGYQYCPNCGCQMDADMRGDENE